MKLFLKNFFLNAILKIVCILIPINSFSQAEPRYSPDGLLDTVCDRFGARIPIGNIYIPTAKFGTANVISSVISTCQAGYFTLHFESGSIFDLSSSARTVACKVFEDVSNLIVSNAAPGSVHIHCGSPTGPGLAEASPFFVFPSNLTNQNQGIIDGQVYKAIVSGTNPYLSLPLSLNNANQIYHGFVNAATTSTAFPWNYNLTTTAIASNEYDMYSVLLHEATHSLGFLSLMRYDGLSAFTPTNINFPYYNYYHRYDLFLHDNSNNPLLTAPLGSCAISGLTFAPTSYSVIGEGMSTCTLGCPQDITTCSVAAKYIGSTTAKVYTPYYYEPGSSLSHFEDMCFGTYTGSCIPTPTSPGYNNLYFTMSNFTSPGSCYVKRHPTAEERQVLCDLGYSVNTVYGGTVVAGSSYTYSGGACSPTNIIGENDGYFNGQFTLQVVALNSTVIPFSTLTINDVPSMGLSVSCMELITNNATLTVGSTDFSVTVQAGGGLVVLKYIPRNSLGQIGNATFVFINFVPPGCNSCGIVNNGGFEYSVPGQNNCGFLQNWSSNPPQPKIDCWYVYGTNYTADLLTTVCPNMSLELGVYTMATSQPINTIALGAGTNTNVLGLKYTSAINGTGVVMNSLNSPLVNGQTYQVSFWIINYGSPLSVGGLNAAEAPVVLSLASSTSGINPQGIGTPGFPNGLNSLCNFTIAAGTTWAQVTNTFVYSQSSSASQIVFGINPNLTQSPGTFTNNQFFYYCFVDQFSIIEVPGPNFSISNNTICTSANISNLAQFTGTTPGTFSGPGVSFDGTSYHFNSPATLSPGVYGIAFTYSASNCMKTQLQSVVVENCCNSSSIPEKTITTVTGTPAWVGPLRLPNSFTIATGQSLMLNGEFLISPNVTITVKPYAQLFLIGAHLYGCLEMWKGIEVEDGGRVIAQSYNGSDNLIEDAEIAISVPYNTNIQVPLSISSTIFNKNHIDVDIANYSLASALISPFDNCVFTCRDLPFTPTTWPSVSTTSTGLRFASIPASALASPYNIQNASITTLKIPHTGEHSHIALKLQNMGRTDQNGTAPLTFYHPNLTPSTGFNLYDAHDYFIKSTNSNVKIANSVFQNTQTFLISNTPTVGAAIDYSCSTLTTYTPNSTIDNFELDMSAASFTAGNKFYDCHKAIVGNNPWSFKLEKCTIRSTHLGSDATNTAVISTGQTGVFMRTNQIEDYLINNNEFANVTDGVVISLYPENVMRPGFPYYPGPPQQVFMINAYIHTLSVVGNTFSPENNITFYGSTSGYVKNAVSVSSDNYNMTAVVCGCTGIHIEKNEIYRALNGISLNSVNPYTVTCKNVGVKKIIQDNRIILEEDNIFGGITQRGITFMNSVSEPMNNGQRLQLVKSNTITVFGSPSVQTNTNISLYYGTMNGAVNNNTLSLFPTPHILCNVTSNANRGFEFESWNRPASWRGNKMEDLRFGMQLNSAGHIGEQGDINNPIDNEWNGSWPSTYSTTNVDATSDAANSMLWVRNGSMPYWPSNNGYVSFFDSYDLTGNLNISSSGSYNCSTENYSAMSSPLPAEDDYSNDDLFYIANTFAYRYLAINDSMRNTATDLSDFYDDLAGSSIDKFMQVEMKINERNFSEAQTILNEIDQGAFNAIETTQYSFYSLSLKYKVANSDSLFSPDDLDALATLASQCPGTKGNSVYQARALYQLITGTVFNGTDGCSVTGARMAWQETKKKGDDALQNWSISVFPNPLQEKLTITNSIKDGVIDITITDLTGRIMNKQKLKCNGNTGTLNLDLINGAYFITISNSLNETITKKILIAK